MEIIDRPRWGLLTEPEVADVFGVSLRTVRRWGLVGVLERVKVGGVIRYRASDVDRLAAPPVETAG